MDSQARTKDFDLTALLAPINPEDFFRDYWERKPLHLSRKDPHYYDTVLNNGDLESIISYPDLRYPAIQLARDGGYLAPEAFTRDIKHGTEGRRKPYWHAFPARACEGGAERRVPPADRPARAGWAALRQFKAIIGNKATANQSPLLRLCR